MTDCADARLGELRRKLRERGDALPSGTRKLARAVVGESDDVLAHQDCLAALPIYVDAEMDSARVAEKFPNVKRHLDLCEECAAQYAELLETALANQAGQIPAAIAIPMPDLGFLSLSLVDFVKQKAAEILAAIAPAQVPDLASITDIFFERLNGLGGKFVLQPRAVQALGFESGELGTALVTLAATYAATDAIVNTFTPDQIESLAARNLLRSQIEESAHAAALAIQVEPGLAQKIAAQFAERTCADPASLRALVEYAKQ